MGSAVSGSRGPGGGVSRPDNPNHVLSHGSAVSMGNSGILSAPTMSVGLLVLRVVVGLYMAAHGAQKLFGWFKGHGLAGTAGAFEQLGFRPGHVFARIAAGAEVVSGLLVTVGLFGPVGPALMISVMIVAMGSVRGWWVAPGHPSTSADVGGNGLTI
jgi:uncharacterized membrane protein YphA (DoxX/SURF4 family)